MRNHNQRAAALMLSAAMAASMCLPASAAGNQVSIVLDNQPIQASAYVDGSSRTQVAVDIAQKLGMEVKQDGKSVTFTKGGKSVTFEAGSDKLGEATMDTAAAEGYVPLKYLAEQFAYDITWDGQRKTVMLNSKASDDFDSILALDIDWTQAAQLPVTGYYTKSFDDGRSVKVYISEEASIRTYITVVAVPDGVDTKAFLEEQGWLALADQKGEALFVLEPSANGWGSVEEEADYINEAIGFLKSGRNDNGVGVFSTFGEFYLVGYGKSAAPLELWAAENPIFVISQVYLNGETAGKAALDKAGAGTYDEKNTGGYQPIPDFEATLKEAGMTQIARKDVPVPTWFVNYAGSSDSIAYWKTANDCVATAQDGVFYQDKNSDAYQTSYANSVLPASATHGISQVKVSDQDVKASDIYSFLATYTRYDNTFAYSNALAYRVDYTAARVAAQQQAKAGSMNETLQSENGAVALTAMSDVKVDGGTVQVGVFAFSDNNEDGKNDPREYMVYIPDGYQGKKLPVVCVYPGNTQSDSIFFDCTQWYQVANENGFALAFVCETYSAATAITHKDAVLYQPALMTVLEQKVDGKLASLDFTRVYGTGQSLGSMTTQGFARSNPEFFAAVAATSGIMDMGGTDTNLPMPTYLITGQSDLDFLLPDLATAENLPGWANYFLKVNGLNTEVGTKENNYGASSHEFEGGRTHVYTWTTQQGVPMVKWGQTLLRSHNCYPSEMPMMWDYMKHFSFEKAQDGTITRYYSASAFEKNDAVEIK